MSAVPGASGLPLPRPLRPHLVGEVKTKFCRGNLALSLVVGPEKIQTPQEPELDSGTRRAKRRARRAGGLWR